MRHRCGAPRRILLLTELFPPQVGGSAVLFQSIYSRLSSVPVTVLTDGTGGARPPDGDLLVTEVPMAAPDWGLLRPASLRRHLRVARRIIAESRRAPLVVHCGRALPEGLSALWASCLLRLPYVCWTHGEELEYVKGSRELRFLLSRVHRHAAAVVANSAHTARALAACQMPPEKIRLVHPGVDPDRFARAPHAESIRARVAHPGDLVLMTVGRLQRRKGHDLVLEALAHLRTHQPKLSYLVVGDGEERTRLQALTQQLGLTDRVTFVGAVPVEDLPSYYGAADIFVHPNRIDGRDVEGFGIVFLEAAAAGLPTIGGATGGVPEAVEQGTTGLLVSGTDAGELAVAIRTLASSASLRRSMGEAGRSRVRAHFTWDQAAARVAAIHREIAEAA